MANGVKRISCVVDEQTYARLTDLKKTKYYDIPWSSLYRICLDKGLDKMLKENKEK